MREYNCLLTERVDMCLGPLTLGGCNARCPGLSIGCVGCRGPVDDANLESVTALFMENGFGREDIARKLRTFAGLRVVAHTLSEDES